MQVEVLLEEFLKSKAGVPFEYGKNDCCLFGADWVLMYKGVDYGASFRGTYDSALSAARIIKDNGGDLVAFFSKLLSRQSKPRLHAKAGDIMVCNMEGVGQTAGVCLGARAMFVALDGVIEPRDITDCLCAFTIE